MRVYKVEVFSESFDFKFNDVISEIQHDEDYLNTKENSVVVRYSENVANGDFIHVNNKNESYFGKINAVTKNKNTMTITYKPFNSLFDMSILFDTNLQGTLSLENILKGIIQAYFVNNTDTLQNISILGTITLLSNTTVWGFNLKSDTENMHHCIINFYNVLLANAFSKYGVVVNTIPNFTSKKVDLTIGKVNLPVYTIESDLPNILDKSIIIRQTSKNTNKLVVWNDANYTESIVYYLHADGTYNTTNSNRITPVVVETKSVKVEDGSTFSIAAQSVASETFGDISYKNLIELEVIPDDTLVKPKEMQIGQTVNIIHKGISYNSILSGKEIKPDKIKLIFGTIRLNLTSIVKKGGI